MLGIIRILLGSFIVLIRRDLKKMVAYSTLSQLGFIFMTFYNLILIITLMHLLIHAFFKRLLFIIVGNIIIKNFSQHSKKRKLGINKFINISLSIIIFLNFLRILFRTIVISKENNLLNILIRIKIIFFYYNIFIYFFNIILFNSFYFYFNK